MRINAAGLLLAGTLWLLAVVLAWPAEHPTAAIVLLAAQAAVYTGVAISGEAATVPHSGARLGRRRPR